LLRDWGWGTFASLAIQVCAAGAGIEGLDVERGSAGRARRPDSFTA